jgi:hypothetical protein
MALSRFGLALALMVGVSSANAQEVTMELYNNTNVDLCVERRSQFECIEIYPGKAARVVLHARQWINFGMEAHQYRLPAKVTNKKQETERVIKLQAEGDGKLYRIPSEATVPVKVMPKQPAGFPLRPIKVVDLT